MKMYIPPAFVENRPDELRDIIRATSLPLIVSAARAKTGGTQLVATHLPLILDGDQLIGHVARANDHWKFLDPEAESLAIFAARDGYISPSWYATKGETGRVVPTWNYEAVHAYGRLEIIQEPDLLLPIVTRLTRRHEDDREHPWQVSDAPSEYISSQLKGIVGIVLHISRLEGKRKLSQNKTNEDQLGVIAGLSKEKPDLAKAMLKAREPES
jgi:transcriptional regulator